MDKVAFFIQLIAQRSILIQDDVAFTRAFPYDFHGNITHLAEIRPQLQSSLISIFAFSRDARVCIHDEAALQADPFTQARNHIRDRVDVFLRIFTFHMNEHIALKARKGLTALLILNIDQQIYSLISQRRIYRSIQVDDLLVVGASEHGAIPVIFRKHDMAVRDLWIIFDGSHEQLQRRDLIEKRQTDFAVSAQHPVAECFLICLIQQIGQFLADDLRGAQRRDAFCRCKITD